MCTSWRKTRARASLSLQAARGLTASQYFASNLLKREVIDTDVALAFLDAALAMKTTGGIYTVDGGNIAASPR